MKTCVVCKQAKPLSEFGVNLRTKDGLTAQCLPCRREAGKRNQRRYAARHRDRVRIIRRRSYAKNPESEKRSTRRWQENNPERASIIAKARAAVAKAIKSGRLVRPDRCSDCGRVGPVEASHHDYSKPLDVTWLCRRCHRLRDTQQPRSVQ